MNDLIGDRLRQMNPTQLVVGTPSNRLVALEVPELGRSGCLVDFVTRPTIRARAACP